MNERRMNIMTETKKYKIHLKNGSDVKTEISVTYYNCAFSILI